MWGSIDLMDLLARRRRKPVAPASEVDPLAFAVPDIPLLPKRGEGDPEELLSRPVVALDVDGVLNVLGRRDVPDHVAVIDTVIPAWACAEATWLSGQGALNRHLSVTVDPAHADWITGLLERGIEVVWCTTWETAAPVVYGPLLGLPPLPVVQLRAQPWWKEGSASVKAQELMDLFDGRPLVWLDDHSHEYERGDHYLVEREPAWPTLVPEINPWQGLTREVRDTVDHWLAQGPSGAPGPRLSYRHGMRFQQKPTRHKSRVRITTTKGVLNVKQTNGDAPIYELSARLQRETGLPSWLRTPMLACQGSNNITVGEGLTLHQPWSSDPHTQRTIDLGTVRSITMASVPEPRPWSQRSLPDLETQKQQQAEAVNALAQIDAVTSVAFHPRHGASAWDGDTLLQLEVTDGRLLRVTAYTEDGDTENEEGDLVPTYGDVTVHVGDAPDNLFGRGDLGFHTDTLQPADTAVFMLTKWREWDRRRACAHDGQTDAYCSRCGTSLDDDTDGTSAVLDTGPS